jgi:hypothetical protein
MYVSILNLHCLCLSHYLTLKDFEVPHLIVKEVKIINYVPNGKHVRMKIFQAGIFLSLYS